MSSSPCAPLPFFELAELNDSLGSGPDLVIGCDYQKNDIHAVISNSDRSLGVGDCSWNCLVPVLMTKIDKDKKCYSWV